VSARRPQPSTLKRGTPATGFFHIFFFNARACAISFFMVTRFSSLGGGAAGESQTKKAVFYSKGA
jgi:hypothetical protein